MPIFMAGTASGFLEKKGVYVDAGTASTAVMLDTWRRPSVSRPAWGDKAAPSAPCSRKRRCGDCEAAALVERARRGGGRLRVVDDDPAGAGAGGTAGKTGAATGAGGINGASGAGGGSAGARGGGGSRGDAAGRIGWRGRNDGFTGGASGNRPDAATGDVAVPPDASATAGCAASSAKTSRRASSTPRSGT